MNSEFPPDSKFAPFEYVWILLSRSKNYWRKYINIILSGIKILGMSSYKVFKDKLKI